MSSRDHRFQELLGALRKQIENSFVPGERLPTKRRLALLHGVGPRTVERALKVLENEGCVKVVPRLGSVKAGVDNRRSGRDGLNGHPRGQAAFSVGLMSRFTFGEWPNYSLYPTLLEEAARRNIRVVPLPNPHGYRQTAERNKIELTSIPWNTFDVGLLVEAEDTIRLQSPLLLAHKVLAVDQDATEYGLDSVAFKDVQVGALAARHLLSLGHRRFAITDEVNNSEFPCDPSWVTRKYGFEKEIGAAGGNILPQWRLAVPRRGYFVDVDFLSAPIAAWAAMPRAQRPTALFSFSPTPLILGKIIDELARHGMRVPRDMSVVSVTWGGQIYGGGEPEKDGMRYTCVDLDLTALSRRVYDAAEELADEVLPDASVERRAPKLFHAPVMLVPGNSTSPAS